MSESESRDEAKVADGDSDALARLFQVHQPRLKRMVAVRMDPRLHARLGDSDVMQDVYLDAQKRMREYDPQRYPFFVWLRLLTGQRLVDLHRHHMGAQQRSINRELRKPTAPDASTDSLATYFIGTLTAPSQATVRAEIQLMVRTALQEMDPIDRELLSLRHFEQLSNSEAAHHLELNPSTASSRYLRAVRKLHEALSRIPGYSDEHLS
jgi:RNA polymerase sigma-70 factor (ECF subfamily)